MPFAICRRCESVFIVGSGDEAGEYSHCPRCGSDLEPTDSAEVIRKVEEQKPPPSEPPGEGAASAHVRTGLSAFARPAVARRLRHTLSASG
jgi:hypothetical protein